jgi:hypothetical protein
VSHVYLECFGVKLDIEVQAESLSDAVERILPPGWTPLEEFPEDGHLVIRERPDGFEVLADGVSVSAGLTQDVAVHLLDSQIRARVALFARDRLFIHAGVVGVDGRALLLPGPSFSGKTALVKALVAEGATYFSDEYAVLDVTGRVHPYPRHMSLREPGRRLGDYTSVETLGGQAATSAADVALIVITRFEPDHNFDPERRPPGVGALTLLKNAIPARTRTAETLTAVGRAVEGAVVLEGERGDADTVAAPLLRRLEALT